MLQLTRKSPPNEVNPDQRALRPAAGTSAAWSADALQSSLLEAVLPTCMFINHDAPGLTLKVNDFQVGGVKIIGPGETSATMTINAASANNLCVGPVIVATLMSGSHSMNAGKLGSILGHNYRYSSAVDFVVWHGASAARKNVPPYFDAAIAQVDLIATTATDLISAAEEAKLFLAKLTALSAQPSIWSDYENEIVFEWIGGARHAIVSFEGDGEFGYALKEGDKFLPGAFRGSLSGPLPVDLSEYINAK